MSDISSKLRRIVTGQNADGRSCIFLDGPPAESLVLGGLEELHEIWTLPVGPLRRAEDVDRGKGKIALSPPAQGIKVRWFTLDPAGHDTSDKYSKIFELIGGDDARPDITRHPAMHLTQTIDFIILLRGQVRLLLDDDECVIFPGDIVVQRGTNHAWVCESEEPALLVAVLIDKDFAN